MKNPIKQFYKLKYIEQYEDYIKSKKVFLACCLMLANLLGGLLYGYALGTIGGGLASASEAFFPSNTSSVSTVSQNSTIGRGSFNTLGSTHMNNAGSSDSQWMSNGQWQNLECFFNIGLEAINQGEMFDYEYFGSCMQNKKTSKSGAYYTNWENSANTTNGTTTTNKETSHFNLETTLLQGLFASSIFIGGLFGCLFSMFTGSALGRKFSIILSCIISMIGSIGGAASYQYSTLIVLRCILGFGSGIATAVSSVYVIELMPFPKYMGLLGSVFNLGISLGTTFGYVFGAIFVRSSEMWRAVHAFHNLFIIPLLLLVIFIIPESPLFIHGGHHDHEGELKKQKSTTSKKDDVSTTQEQSLPETTGANPTGNSPVLEEKKVRFEENVQPSSDDLREGEPTHALPHISSAFNNEEMQGDDEEMEKEENAADIEVEQPTTCAETIPKEEPKKTMSTIAACKRLFCSKVLKSMIVACWGCFAMEYTGIQSALMFTPSLIASAGVTDPLNQQLASFGLAVWQLFCIIPTMFLVDKFGRKPIMLFGFTISFLTDLAEGFIFQYGENGTEYKIALALFFICLYLIGFHVGVGSLGYVLAYEVFRGENEKVVILGTSIATISMWSTSIILSLFFIPLVVVSNQAVPWFIFAGISFIGIIIYATLLDETSPHILAKRSLAISLKESNSQASTAVSCLENVQAKEEKKDQDSVETNQIELGVVSEKPTEQ